MLDDSEHLKVTEPITIFEWIFGQVKSDCLKSYPPFFSLCSLMPDTISLSEVT